MQKCRHNSSWIIAGGHWEWCYACGALRELRKIAPNGSVPYTQWVKPTGKPGNNPWDRRKLSRHRDGNELASWADCVWQPRAINA